MNFIIIRVKQYNATFKHVLLIDGLPILLASSEERARTFVEYIKGSEVLINDGEVKKILNIYRKRHMEVCVSA